MVDVDLIIVLVFLLVTLIIGIKTGTGVKNIKDYAIGGKSFNTTTLIASVTATWICGGFFTVSVSETYSSGIWFMIIGLGDAISLLVIGYVFVPRMINFMDNISVAEVMGLIYGKNCRIITAVSSILLSVSLFALQVKVSASLFSYFLSINSIYATVICASIVIFYSAFGGIKSVTFTDVLQFVTFGI